MSKRKAIWLAAGLCLLLGACGEPKEDAALFGDAVLETKEAGDTEETTVRKETEEPTDTQAAKQEDGPSDSADTASVELAGRGAVILEQSFDVHLAPLGDVRFVSYAPGQASGDAVFVVEQDGADLFVLDGMKDGNVRTEDTFEQVEAVSFPDYNGDGNDDIIIICRYRPADGTESFSEARLYEGTTSGGFVFRKELSKEATSALSDITVESVKGFLGADRKNPADAKKTQESWQQAYINHIREHSDINDGYTLIYLDDDEIPELAEIGDCEASGCRIVVYSNGSLKETQLYRLYFSYIERENLLCNSDGHMDVYYDYVYRIQDGELVMAEKGDYGASNNANVQFDENGEPIYEYYWNGEQMPKEDYEQALHAVYDETKAKEGYQWGAYDSAEEMIRRLEQMDTAVTLSACPEVRACNSEGNPDGTARRL